MTVSCDAVLDALSEGRPLGPPEQAHADACPRCRLLTSDDDALARLFSNVGAAPTMSPALAAVVAAPVTAVRLRHPLSRALALLAPGAIALGGVTLVAVRRDFAALSWAARWSPVLAMLSLAVVGVGLASARGRDNLGPHHGVRLAVAIATFSAFEAVSLLVGEGPLWGGEAGHHVACALSATALPAVLTPLALLALRGMDPVRPALTGASVGAAVAAFTAVIQHLECASPSLAHVAFSHGWSFLVGSTLGAALGRRWLVP
jgi:hypothetical protein